jgi:hypothetical protein
MDTHPMLRKILLGWDFVLRLLYSDVASVPARDGRASKSAVVIFRFSSNP